MTTVAKPVDVPIIEPPPKSAAASPRTYCSACTQRVAPKPSEAAMKRMFAKLAAAGLTFLLGARRHDRGGERWLTASLP